MTFRILGKLSRRRKNRLLKRGYRIRDGRLCKTVPEHRTGREKRYLRLLGYRFEVCDMEQSRSGSYRKEFLDANRGKKLHCAYCGRRLIPSSLTVDHIFPVHKALVSPATRRFMKVCGIENVNDMRNLTASCPGCNSRKGDREGHWIILGFLGRKNWFWPAVRTLQSLLVLSALAILFWWILGQ